jgi:uncharacterized Zn finger protein
VASNSVPNLSTKQIRRWVSGQSLDRGTRYFNDGCIFDGRREGLALKAKCEGSQGGPYRVRTVLTPAGEVDDAGCSCPVGGGGRCKHVAALLLTFREYPGKFPETASVNATLAKMSREHLVALVRQMLREQPDLEPLLRAPLPVPGEKSAPAKPEAYRRQARGVFDRAGDEWGAESQIADGLEGVLELADDFVHLDQPAGAAAVYEGVASEVLSRVKGYEYADEGGDLLGVIATCAEKAAALLPKLTDAAARGRVIQFLLDVYRYDLDAGGIDALGEAYESLLEDTTPDERRTIADWARKELKKNAGWAAEALGALLLDLEGDTLDDEAFLRVCRETGRRDDLIDRLLKLGRADEAAEELRRAKNGFELARLADLFAPHGHGDVAEGVVLERLRRRAAGGDAGDGAAATTREFDQVTLLEWLKRRAAARGDDVDALALALRVFKVRPSREGYDEIKRRATKGGTWDATRPELLKELAGRGGGYRDVLARIHLDEGRVDDALELVKPRRRQAPGAVWGYFSDGSLELDIAKAAEKVRPKAAMEIYRSRAESLVAAGQRESYREACRHLKKLRKLHQDTGEAAEWEKYVSKLREANSNRRALREEMAKAGL